MGKKGSLRDFQAHLATRLAGASDQSAAGLLGVQSGADYWLLSLSDSGEIGLLLAREAHAASTQNSGVAFGLRTRPEARRALSGGHSRDLRSHPRGYERPRGRGATRSL